MATKTETRLPYGIGQVGPGFYILVVALLAVVGLGAYAYSRQFMEGEAVTGMRDLGTMGGAAWGLYIGFVIYFVGVSFAGITVAALIRILGLEQLRPLSRMAELLTVIALVLGGMSVLVDLGQPARGITNLFLYARPQSPFFGTFTLVISAYFVASLVYLYLGSRRDVAILAQRPGRLQGLYRLWAAGYRDTPAERERHARSSWWLSLFIVPLLVTAHSTLGFVFGLQRGAAGWFSAVQAPSFLALAGVSGIGTLIVIAAVARQMLNLKKQLPIQTFAWMGNFLWVLLVVYLYFILVETLTEVYQGEALELRVTSAMVTGTYAWLYWLTVGLLVIPLVALFTQSMRRRYNLPVIVAAGVLVNIAAMAKRFLIVVPSQTHGRALPYDIGSYSPSWVEYVVILGFFALGALAYVIFFKVCPIMEVPQDKKGGI